MEVGRGGVEQRQLGRSISARRRTDGGRSGKGTRPAGQKTRFGQKINQLLKGLATILACVLATDAGGPSTGTPVMSDDILDDDDLNEEAANSQALSTRQSMGISALSLTNSAQQGVLQLLR